MHLPFEDKIQSKVSLARIAEIKQLEAERDAAIRAEFKTLPVCKAVDGRLVWVQTQATG